MSVEQLARVLGVWENSGADIYMDRSHGGGFRLRAPGASRRGGGHPTVDEGTALIFLLALASGLRLDVGRCPACEERGGGWEWAVHRAALGGTLDEILVPDDWMPDIDGPPWDEEMVVWHDVRVESGEKLERVDVAVCSRPCPECSEPEECQTEGCDGGERHTRLPGGWSSYPCPDCAGTGKQPGPPKPTGRRILGAEAILDATPRERDEDERDIAYGTERPLEEFVALGGCGDLISTTHAPGDQATRNALAVHADQLQAGGDPLGELLAAWLHGECQVCDACDCFEKGGRCRIVELDGGGYSHTGGCGACQDHGTVLGALWPKLEALVAERLKRSISFSSDLL